MASRIIDRGRSERQAGRGPRAGVYNWEMAWARLRPLVALDVAAVSGASLVRSLSGPRIASVARIELLPGALVPSPTDNNLVEPEAVRTAVTRLLAALGEARGAATLVLPDGVARGLVFEAAHGVSPLEQARFKLGPGLPYPAAEAIVDIRPLGGPRFLGVAIRRSVVEAYEALAESTGLSVARVDIASMAALDTLLRLRPEGDSTVDVILGDAAVSLAAHRDGSLRVFRSRRRERGTEEADWLREEVGRTATLAGDGIGPRVRIVGPGAPALARALAARGTRAELGWRAEAAGLPVEAAELPWLGVALP